jgi:hypothetical protein
MVLLILYSLHCAGRFGLDRSALRLLYGTF